MKPSAIACVLSVAVMSCVLTQGKVALRSVQQPEVPVQYEGMDLLRITPDDLVQQELDAQIKKLVEQSGLQSIQELEEHVKNNDLQSVQVDQLGGAAKTATCTVLKLSRPIFYVSKENGARACDFVLGGIKKLCSKIPYGRFANHCESIVEKATVSEVCAVVVVNGGKFTYEQFMNHINCKKSSTSENRDVVPYDLVEQQLDAHIKQVQQQAQEQGLQSIDQVEGAAKTAVCVVMKAAKPIFYISTSTGDKVCGPLLNTIKKLCNKLPWAKWSGTCGELITSTPVLEGCAFVLVSGGKFTYNQFMNLIDC